MTDGPVILLDRDGTMIHEREFLSDPEGVELLPNVTEALRRMAALGATLIVVTNQSGIGRGYYTVADMKAVNERLRAILADEGVSIAGIFFCPHAPDERCNCRKPKLQLVERAAEELGFNLRETYVVGDKLSDVNLGRAAGGRSLLVRTGYGKTFEADPHCQPDAVVDDLLAAAEWIERDWASRKA